MMQITEKSIGLDGQVFCDRRNELRHKVLRKVRLRFNKGYCTLIGVMRDESSGGARLRFGDICAVPPNFEVEIVGSDKIRRATVKWRTLTEIGLSFDD